MPKITPHRPLGYISATQKYIQFVAAIHSTMKGGVCNGAINKENISHVNITLCILLRNVKQFSPSSFSSST